MLGQDKEIVSPSRTYVAFCNKANFDGYYFKKFTLPTSLEEVPSFARIYAACHNIKNDSEYASWYFLNVLDFCACINGCIPFEDYSDMTEVRHGRF